MMRRFLAALCLVALLGAPAGAQQSKANLNALTTNDFPDNMFGAITPAIQRSWAASVISSFQQYAAVNKQTGTSYTVGLPDYGQLITFNNGGAIAVTLPAPTLVAGFYPFSFYVSDIGAGTATLTPTSGQICSASCASNYAVPQGVAVLVVADGTNWQVATSSYSLTIGNSLTGAGANELLYTGSAGNTLSEIATCVSGIFITSASSVPSCSTTLPNTLYQHTQAYVTNGVYTLTVPANVTQMIVTGSGGGSGSGAMGYAATCLVVGTPGYNGETAVNTPITVIPGHLLTITVGAGGPGGATTGITTCVAGNSGANAGTIGGDTTIVDTTASTTLLTLKGGIVGSSQVAQITTSATGFAHYEGNISQAGFAYNTTGPVGIGWYWAPGPFLAPQSINATGNFYSFSAMYGNNFGLAPEPGLYPGQGASSGVSINTNAPIAGQIGHDGIVYLSY